MKLNKTTGTPILSIKIICSPPESRETIHLITPLCFFSYSGTYSALFFPLMVEVLLWPVGYITGGRTWYHRYPDQATKKKLICSHCCGDGLFLAGFTIMKSPGSDYGLKLFSLFTGNCEKVETLKKIGSSSCQKMSGAGLLGYSATLSLSFQ